MLPKIKDNGQDISLLECAGWEGCGSSSAENFKNSSWQAAPVLKEQNRGYSKVLPDWTFLWQRLCFADSSQKMCISHC